MAKNPKPATAPKHAMVLAAGLGTRMRPFNGRVPKPLVPVGGKALIDYVLDRLAAQGVERTVVNVHHLADQIEPHLARLADAFEPARMDALLLLATTASSISYSGRGDFSMAADGRLTRRGEREVVPFVYAGAAILTPAFFAGAPKGAFSMSPLFDRAAEAGRLCGLRLEGVWMHVGTPEAVTAAEKALLAGAA